MQLVDPTSNVEGENAALESWLQKYVKSKRPTKLESEGMTVPETLASEAYEDMAAILGVTMGKEITPGDESHISLVARSASLNQTLGILLDLINNLSDLVPTFSRPLHTLYVTYDIGKTTLHFCAAISKTRNTQMPTRWNLQNRSKELHSFYYGPSKISVPLSKRA